MIKEEKSFGSKEHCRGCFLVMNDLLKCDASQQKSQNAKTGLAVVNLLMKVKFCGLKIIVQQYYDIIEFPFFSLSPVSLRWIPDFRRIKTTGLMLIRWSGHNWHWIIVTEFNPGLVGYYFSRPASSDCDYFYSCLKVKARSWYLGPEWNVEQWWQLDYPAPAALWHPEKGKCLSILC